MVLVEYEEGTFLKTHLEAIFLEVLRDTLRIGEVQCNIDGRLSNIEHFPFNPFYDVAIGFLHLQRETLIVELCYPLPKCEQRSIEMEGYFAISEDLRESYTHIDFVIALQRVKAREGKKRLFYK